MRSGHRMETYGHRSSLQQSLMRHRFPMRWWVLPVAALVVGGHLLPFLVTHTWASVAAVSGLVVAVVVATHLGVTAIIGRSLWRAHV